MLLSNSKFRGTKCVLLSGIGYGIILKESIRFRAEKENSFIQKIKLLGM